MIRVLNSLDQDQARLSVGPDLVPNCLQKLSADVTRGQRVTCMQKVGEVLSVFTLLSSAWCSKMSFCDQSSSINRHA